LDTDITLNARHADAEFFYYAIYCGMLNVY